MSTGPTPEEQRKDRITSNLEAGLFADGSNEYEMRQPNIDLDEEDEPAINGLDEWERDDDFDDDSDYALDDWDDGD